jgi:hypothetical protein
MLRYSISQQLSLLKGLPGMYRILLSVSISFLSFSCSSSFYDDADYFYEIIKAENIKANLEFLASDDLEGREATTKGERLAALFISSELQKYGVKPFYEDSYLQEFELFSYSIDSSSVAGIIDGNKNRTALSYYNDFTANKMYSVTTQGKFNLVFAGFGISAPEYNYNDYSSVDVAGKVVIVYDGIPSNEDIKYYVKEGDAEYSKLAYKLTEAKARGAAGVIVIPSDFTLKNWDRLIPFYKTDALFLPRKKPDEKEKLLCLTLNESSLLMLFDGEEFSFKEIKEKKSANELLPVFELKKNIEVDVKKNEKIKKSFNIVGIIEGNDPELKNEYIAVGAHYDHVGVIDGKVYNGADDNGSGTVALLEVAKTFVQSNSNKRSVMVVFHAAEEKGLLGSEYFTANFDSISSIIAHINMDMVGREHIDTIYSVGSGKLSSEFKKLVEEVNRETVNFVFNYKFDDPDDPQKIYYRSDHYNYAKMGIPIVFFYDYMKDDYHKHTDEVHKINFEKIRKTAILVYNIAKRAANLTNHLKKDAEEISEQNY